MSTTDDNWTSRLHAAVDDHPGARAFDVPSYVAAGRRRARRNRYASLGATVAAIAVVAGVSALAGTGTPHTSPSPVGPADFPLLGPGANGWVAIDSHDGTGDIYLVRPGAAARPLEGAASETATEGCPAWSPDGSRLLFGRATGLSGGTFDKSELVIAPVDQAGAAGQPTVIGLDGFEATDDYESFPCGTWAPDGRWVALAGAGEVWVVDTETSQIRHLPDLRPSDLEWRPGTDELAIAGDSGTHSGSRPESTPVSVYTVSTEKLRKLDSVEAAHLTWSPDGTTFAYTGGDGEADTKQLWLANSDGTGKRLIVPDMGTAVHGIGPTWSPTGDRIAYQRLTGDSAEGHEVVLVDVADGTETVIDPPMTKKGPFYPFTVTWSPDGTALLYVGWAVTDTSQVPDGVIIVAADHPSDVTVLNDTIHWPVPGFHEHQWAPTQMWGRQPGASPSQADASPTGDWPLERIRAEGTLEKEDVTRSGITVRMYAACDGPESVCGPNIDPPIRAAHSHFALEVAQHGRSALFSGDGGNPYVVTAYGLDSVIIFDGEPGIGVDPADPAYGRYRQLRADGTEQLLTLETDPAPAVPGPEVVVIDRAEYEGESTPIQFAFQLDESSGTLRRLDIPHNDLRLGGNSWGPNTDQALWFVQAIDCLVERVVDGSVVTHAACGGDFTGHWYDSLVSVPAEWIPDGWLTPDRMAVLQNTRSQLTLHVSLDQGVTWQHLPVTDQAAIPDALEQLD